jgi:hypothetical protein
MVAIATWKPEHDDAMWARLAERRVPLTDDVKIIEYYNLLGRHQAFAIIDAPDETAVATSTLNWGDIADVDYVPAVTASDFLKLRADLLK